MRFGLVFLFSFFLFFSAKAEGKDAKFYKKILGKFGNWAVLEANPNGKKICYAVLYSTNRIGNYEKEVKDKPYLMVHYAQNKQTRVAFFFGYDVLTKSLANLSIDGAQFALDTYKKSAFTTDYNTDLEIVNLLQTSQEVLIRAENSKSQYTVDKYQIQGFSEALKSLQEKCFAKVTPVS
jgi:hypothetical protein